MCQLHGHASVTVTETVEIMQEAFRKAAIAALTKRLQTSLAAATAAAGADLDSLFNIQAQLTQ